MVRRRPGETDRAYVRRLRAVMVAAYSRPAEVVTPEITADLEIRKASGIVRCGALYGYMAGHRLDDFRRIEAIARDLHDARRLAVPDLDRRTAAAVREAWSVAEPWRERWD
ncbi:MAG TPA: hypothetical protein PLY91_07640 [Methanoregulaceae archaeon]|nr:hypothetical protein [Methanoregulaceae archaeon]